MNGLKYLKMVVLSGIFAFTIILAPKVYAIAPNVATGLFHTCALNGDGNVFCWGVNYSGQLGNGMNYSYSSHPTRVMGLSNKIISIAVSNNHSCALTDNGAVKCWGANSAGQLGNASFNSSNLPVDVVGLYRGVKAIAVGEYHSCALLNTGEVRCWGANDLGQLGNNNLGNSNIPITVNGLLSGVTKLAVGYDHACALVNSSSIKCWGSNSQGQLGNSSLIDSSVPVLVSNLVGSFTSITASFSSTCTLAVSGVGYCWGGNSFGELGNGVSSLPVITPITMSVINSPISVLALGDSHTCILNNLGSVECWGYNGKGAVGDGTTINTLLPETVIGLESNVIALASRDNHNCSILNSGVVKCWGDNYAGQLGNGNTINSSLPVAVLGVNGVGLLNLLATFKVKNDLNGDGITDLVWRQTSTGTIGILFMNSTGAVSSWQGITTDTDWNVVGTGDFNGDGTPDLLWRQTSTGLLGQLFMNSNGTIKGWNGISSGTDWNVVDTADFNGDGITDLLWRQTSTGTIGILFINSTGAVSSWQGITTDTDWNVVGTGDFNGDGTPDLLWRQTSTGLLGELFMNSNGTIKGWNGISSGTDWNVVDTADFNGDGITDLVWRQTSTGTIGILFINSTGAVSSWQGITTDTDWNVVGTGDFNGDGTPDLLWRQTSTGLLGELFMNSNGTIKGWNGISNGTDWNVVAGK
jgi:alpha-tubulin suppressor-like RCC1 family protein